MDRRRSLLKIAALRSEREQQEGVNCTKGYLQLQSAGLLFEGPRTLECLFRYIPSDKMQVIAGFGISMIEIYALTTNQLRVYCGGGNDMLSEWDRSRTFPGYGIQDHGFIQDRQQYIYPPRLARILPPLQLRPFRGRSSRTLQQRRSCRVCGTVSR